MGKCKNGLGQLLIPLQDALVEQQRQQNRCRELNQESANVDLQGREYRTEKGRIPEHISKILQAAPGTPPDSALGAVGLEGQQQPRHGPVGKYHKPNQSGKHQSVDGPVFPDLPPQSINSFHGDLPNNPASHAPSILQIPVHAQALPPCGADWRWLSPHRLPLHWRSGSVSANESRDASQSPE